MKKRVAINGFGRIGRLVFRLLWDHPSLELVLVNDPFCNGATAAHLVQFDSLHGPWPHPLAGEDNQLVSGDRTIAYSSETKPENLPVETTPFHVLIECSGHFRNGASLQPLLDKGVAKAVVSAPLKDDGLNVVLGVNHDLYQPNRHRVISAASCTTNCLAPMVKVVQEHWGIRHGSITTIHSVTNSQAIIDGSHKDPRRGRAYALSMIPTTTGATKAITSIFPHLEGKMDGLAVRVPTLNASLTDCTFEVEKNTTVEEVNQVFAQAAAGPLKGILGYEERPLVSIDYQSDPRSSIVDALSTRVIDKTQVKLLAWYDNEMGYANRLVELVALVAKGL